MGLSVYEIKIFISYTYASNTLIYSTFHKMRYIHIIYIIIDNRYIHTFRVDSDENDMDVFMDRVNKKVNKKDPMNEIPEVPVA